MTPYKNLFRISGPRRSAQRGVALITALLLLLLLTGMGVVMVVSSNSDIMTNGYYRGYRGAFYGADSGLNVARQDLVNQLKLQANANFTQAQQAIANGTNSALAVQTYLQNTYGNAYKSLTSSGQSVKSLPESYQITAAAVSFDPTTGCTLIGGATGGTCQAPLWSQQAVQNGQYGYQYTFPYSLTAVGKSQSTNSATISDRGNVQITAMMTPTTSQQSFAAWGMFIDQSPICNGSTLVAGTISGPTFTNGAWTFGTSGNYVFTDPVGSASAQAGFQFSNKCDQLAAASDSQKNGRNTTLIAPTFQQGYNWGQKKLPLPSDDFNQEQAVLDGKGVASGSVSNTALHNSLMNINKTAYPSTGTSSGVYLPYTIQNGVPTFTGGGIYVQGSAGVTLSTSGTSAQVYTITQGSTTTTITIDPVAGTTTVTSPGYTPLNITGVPEQIDPATNAVQGPGTMLYVNGSITSLSGPGQGQPAIQDGSAVTITAASNVTITGDILYKNEPVTLTQNQIPNTPADTLIPGNDKGQALGIFTANGNIQMANKQSNGNLEIDASLATVCATGTGCTGNGGLVNTGNAINTLTIVGGRIQNQLMNINSTTRNVFFDRRYAQGGFSPPWFPSTTVSLGAVGGGTITATVQRVQWINQTPYF